MSKPLEYIVDEKGNRTKVLLDIKDFEELLEAAEELEDIRAYDEAKALGEPLIPFREAMDEIKKSKNGE